MKFLWIAAITFIMSCPVYAIDIPIECKGKTVTCGEGTGFCYAVYCPKTYNYDDQGKLISIDGGCKPCFSSQRCSCEGFEFTNEERY